MPSANSPQVVSKRVQIWSNVSVPNTDLDSFSYFEVSVNNLNSKSSMSYVFETVQFSALPFSDLSFTSRSQISIGTFFASLEKKALIERKQSEQRGLSIRQRQTLDRCIFLFHPSLIDKGEIEKSHNHTLRKHQSRGANLSGHNSIGSRVCKKSERSETRASTVLRAFSRACKR